MEVAESGLYINGEDACCAIVVESGLDKLVEFVSAVWLSDGVLVWVGGLGDQWSDGF